MLRNSTYFIDKTKLNNNHHTAMHYDCLLGFRFYAVAKLRKMKAKCDICGTEIDIQMCCSGYMCGCQGMPTEPPVCSSECYDKYMKKIHGDEWKEPDAPDIDELLREFDEAIQYFIHHEANASIEFSDKIDKLIDIKADLANGDKQSSSNCNTPLVSGSSHNWKDAYKECFEIFIPADKWDEAQEFLTTYENGLAKEIAKKEK